MRQRGYGLGAIFRDIGRYSKPILNPVLEEVKDVGQTVGLDLLQNVAQDLIHGKSSKASLKSHGKQAGINAADLATKRAIQRLSKKPPPPQQLPPPPPQWIPTSSSGVKRKRDESGSKPAKKAKKTTSKKATKPKKQIGGKKRKSKKQSGKGQKWRQKGDIFDTQEGGLGHSWRWLAKN